MTTRTLALALLATASLFGQGLPFGSIPIRTFSPIHFRQVANSTTTKTVTFSSPTATGSAIVGMVGIDTGGATISAISISTSGQGDTCTALETVATIADYKVQMFYCLNIHGSASHQITVTSGNLFSMVVAEYDNVLDVSAYDLSSSGTNAASPPAGVSSMTPSQSNEVVVAAVIWTGTAGSASGSFSQRYAGNFSSLLDWVQTTAAAVTDVSTATGQTATVAAAFKHR